MLPKPDDLMFCIMRDGEIVTGTGGIAIGRTEQDAWDAVIGHHATVETAQRTGCVVARCAVMVINAPEAK